MAEAANGESIRIYAKHKIIRRSLRMLIFSSEIFLCQPINYYYYHNNYKEIIFLSKEEEEEQEQRAKEIRPRFHLLV